MHISRMILPACSSQFLTLTAALLGSLVHPSKKVLSANRTFHFSTLLTIGENIARRIRVKSGIDKIFRGCFSTEAIQFSGGLLPRGDFCTCGKERLGRVHKIINNSEGIDLANTQSKIGERGVGAKWLFGYGCLIII